tara:strand:+ start:4345 stop:4746 length:402 start_codon:yes stop_codon:yes gene_type:complete
MALSGAKFQEASMGQYGSTLLVGDSDKLDVSATTSTKYICAITFLEDTTFQNLENANGSHLQNACISTVDGEDEIATPWGGAVTGEASNFAVIVTTSHVFPKGVTIYGNWDKVELNSGTCILYLAPTGRNVEA